ncbi:hypothetical protein FKM82_022820 [Ascaphus truei]
MFVGTNRGRTRRRFMSELKPFHPKFSMLHCLAYQVQQYICVFCDSNTIRTYKVLEMSLHNAISITRRGYAVLNGNISHSEYAGKLLVDITLL